MAYTSKSKREQKARFGFAGLLLASSALLFLFGGSKKKPEQPEVPVGATMEYDPRRRQALIAGLGVAAGAAGAAAAMRFPGLTGSLARGQAPKPGSGIYAELTASGQAVAFPGVTSTPAGLSPGAMTYRSDLGQWIGQDGILGQARFPGQPPNVVVSPVGITNSKSTLFNGGWGQFGSDTLGTATSGIQEAMSYCGAAGGGVVQMRPGVFNVTSTPTMSYSGVSLIGSGATRMFAGVLIPDPGALTGLAGSYISVSGTGIDGFLVDTFITGAVIRDVSIQMTSASTGHGFHAESLSDPNASSDRYCSIMSSVIDNVTVMGTDSSHFGFYMRNFSECQFGLLTAELCNGGCFHFECNEPGWHYGNTWMAHLTGRGGIASGYSGAIGEFIGGSGNELNLIDVGRCELQAQGYCGSFLKASYFQNARIFGIDCEGYVSAGDAISLLNTYGVIMQFDILAPDLSGAGTNNFTVTNPGAGNIFYGDFNGVTLNDNSGFDLFYDVGNSPTAPNGSSNAMVNDFGGPSFAAPALFEVGEYSTSSSSAVVVAGVGPVKPDRFGRIMVVGDFDLYNATDSAFMVVGYYYSTSAVPTQGAAPGGSDVNFQNFPYDSSPNGIGTPFHREAVVYGLTVNKQYYFYFTIRTASGTLYVGHDNDGVFYTKRAGF